MIITSVYKLEPGKIYNEKDFEQIGFWHWEDFYNVYTFFVIKEVTIDQYILHCLKERPTCDVAELTYHDHYYHISMD